MDTNSILSATPMFFTNASICDTTGELLFYSNGITISNRNHDTLQNSIDFNPGWETDYSEPEGLLSCQAVLVLPYPNHDKEYFVFHESGEIFGPQVHPFQLRYSIIDMNIDGGLGGIIDTAKNKYAIEDTLSLGGLSATKHANGRDWWILVRRFNEGKYYKLLLTPNGIENISEEDIGAIVTHEAIVQASFSPDGTKRCFTSWEGIFEYMDFDRCTGELSNLITAFAPDFLDWADVPFLPIIVFYTYPHSMIYISMTHGIAT